MYKLIIEDDEGKTTVVPLIRDEITIGRKEGNTIRLTERNVSRKHAKLIKNNGAIFIWWDETEGSNANDFSHTLEEIVISPLAKGNAFNSTLNYTHSSDLKTMEELFGVYAAGGGFLGDANSPGTNDLADLFVAGAISTPEPPALAVWLLVAGAIGAGWIRQRPRQIAPMT